MLGLSPTANHEVSMRAALLIVLGLAIGILGTVQVMNVLSERNPLPKAVMHVMAYHAGELKHAMEAQRCDAQSTRPHLLALQAVSSDIHPAFAGADPALFQIADKLRHAADAAVQADPADCPALAAAIEPVGEACQSCHQQYR
jgi:Cytochrome c556